MEAFMIAEAEGVTPEEAAAILDGQFRQTRALDRLVRLVGEEMIVNSAFDPDFRKGDELTVYVVDADAVAVVSGHLAEAGFDLAKTRVAIAPEPEPDSMWDWLEEDRFAGYEWLESPGPHLEGAWRLVERNSESPDVAVVAGFGGTRWSVEQCGSWVGHYLTSVGGTVTVLVDEDKECGDAATVVNVKEQSGEEFDVRFEGERMIWAGPAAAHLVWEPYEESLPTARVGSKEGYDAWLDSVGPAMEGVWHLETVSGEVPAAPVSAFVGVSTIGFEGQCNRMEGLFALTPDASMATYLAQNLMGCIGPTGVVEEQMGEVLSDGLLEVSVEGDTMKWRSQSGREMVWSR